ncbi:hypothetical protein GJ496_010321 [Pomphorhynchus laevis]|nr:hypothetical protein GJ496_010321 [Pomphorhynchus laevis]
MQKRVSIVNDIFNNVKFRTPNLFYIPRGSSGSEFVDKVAELLELASSENENSKYALAEVTVISQKITRRIKWWNDGRLYDLLTEAKYLQQKHRQHMVKHRTFHPSNKVDWRKEFINMFCRGKVTASMRCLRAEGKPGRILSLKDTLNCQMVRQRLEQLHPIAQDLNIDLELESPLQGSVNHREALFSDLDAVQIKAAA